MNRAGIQIKRGHIWSNVPRWYSDQVGPHMKQCTAQVLRSSGATYEAMYRAGVQIKWGHIWSNVPGWYSDQVGPHMKQCTAQVFRSSGATYEAMYRAAFSRGTWDKSNCAKRATSSQFNCFKKLGGIVLRACDVYLTVGVEIKLNMFEMHWVSRFWPTSHCRVKKMNTDQVIIWHLINFTWDLDCVITEINSSVEVRQFVIYSVTTRYSN
jgi:hypothetical protein